MRWEFKFSNKPFVHYTVWSFNFYMITKKKKNIEKYHCMKSVNTICFLLLSLTWPPKFNRGRSNHYNENILYICMLILFLSANFHAYCIHINCQINGYSIKILFFKIYFVVIGENILAPIHFQNRMFLWKRKT